MSNMIKYTKDEGLKGDTCMTDSKFDKILQVLCNGPGLDARENERNGFLR